MTWNKSKRIIRNSLLDSVYRAIIGISNNHEDSKAMIVVTQNYFQDLNTAIAAGLFIANAKPKKVTLYAEIAAYNASLEADKDQTEDKAISHPQPVETQAIDIKALEAAGDETAVSAALLAMDAELDRLAAATPAASKQRKSSKPSPEALLETLECVCADVETRGVVAIAQMLGTSRSRLTKRIKAYQLMQSNPQIKAAFLSGQLSFSFVCEMAIRRDGLTQILDRLSA